MSRNGKETEEITIESTWRASALVEVPKGWRPGDTLDDWPEDVLDQVTTSGAELIDWEAR
jgi:hypothetical protein